MPNMYYYKKGAQSTRVDVCMLSVLESTALRLWDTYQNKATFSALQLLHITDTTDLL